MAQEKQKSVKILQSKPVKPVNKLPRHILLGVIIAILVVCIFLILFFFKNSSRMQQETHATNQKEQVVQHNSNDVNENGDADYHNQVNDKDLSGLFRHQKNNTAPASTPTTPVAQKPESSSPFDTIFGQEKKVSPAPPVNKPTQPVVLQKSAPSPTVKTPQSAPTPAPVPKKPSLLEHLDIDKELENPLLNNKSATPAKAKEE